MMGRSSISTVGSMVSTALLILGFLGLAACRAPEPGLDSEAPAAEVAPAESPADVALVEPRSRSTRAALRNVELALLGWAPDGDHLQLQISFENLSQDSLALVGDLSGSDFLLVDRVGQELQPAAISLEIEELAPESGLAPGSWRQGRLSFGQPLEGTLELRLPSFKPLIFRLSALPRLEPIELRPQVDEPVEAFADQNAEDFEQYRGAIQELLDRQARALEIYDIETYLGTFAPTFRVQERSIFQRLRLVPIASARFEILAPPRRGSDGLWRLTTELRLAIDGLAADNPMVYTPLYLLRQDGQDWWIEEIRPGSGQRMFWREDELTLHRANHFRIYAHPSQQGSLAEVATEAEAAYAELQRQGLPLDTAYLIHLQPDRQAFARVAGTDRALGVALARYELVGARMSVDSRAFYINGGLLDGQWRRLTRQVRHLTITHELVHLALARQTRPFTPPWLKEGVAVYFSRAIEFDATRKLFRKGLDHLDLVAMTSASVLGEHDAFGEQTADEYLYAGNVIAYLVETYGKERFLEFYGSFAALNVGQLVAASMAEGGSKFNLDSASSQLATRLTSEALATYYQVGLEELEEAVREWLWVRHR